MVAAERSKSGARAGIAPKAARRPDLASGPMSLGPVLAALPATLPAAVVRAGDRSVIAVGATDRVLRPTAEPGAFDALDRIDTGWWAGYASYDAGRGVERVSNRAPVEPNLPDLNFVRFAVRAELGADGSVALIGSGAERRALERALDAPVAVPPPPPSAAWSGSLDRLEYERRVRAIQELIRAGECYQVNLTRRLTGPARDSAALFAATESGNPAPHAAFWRDGTGLAIVSASPSASSGSTAARSRPGRSKEPTRELRACAPARRTAPRTS